MYSPQGAGSCACATTSSRLCWLGRWWLKFSSASTQHCPPLTDGSAVDKVQGCGLPRLPIAAPVAPVHPLMLRCCPVSCSSLLRTGIALSCRCLCSWSAQVFVPAALPCTPPCRFLVPPARGPKRILQGMVVCTCHVASHCITCCIAFQAASDCAIVCHYHSPLGRHPDERKPDGWPCGM